MDRRPRYNPTERDFRYDGEPRPMYYGDYREAYNKYLGLGILRSGHELPREVLVLFILNNTIKPEGFDLKKTDKQPLGELIYPGKSATLGFTTDRDVACGAIFDRSARRDKHTDYLYQLSVEELLGLGYHAFYAPLPNNPLHVRVVHETQINNPEEGVVPFRARVKLAQTIQEHRLP